MKPIKFPGSNIVYAEDQPEYQPLPAMRMPDGMVITCWELSDEELKIVLKNRKIYIQLHTFNQPLQPILPLVELSDGLELI